MFRHLSLQVLFFMYSHSVLLSKNRTCLSANSIPLVMNTTSCTIVSGNTTDNGTITNHTFTMDSEIYYYNICTIYLNEAVPISSNIRVHLSGRNGLVINSNSNITISSNITAEGPPLDNHNYDMWLGGYCTRPTDNYRSKGAGPGGGGYKKFGGAGHGDWGMRAYQNGTLYGKIYGFNNSYVERIGGSSGGVSSRGSAVSCGGGVIEISSSETIFIDATISTNAITTNSSGGCIAGSSGGTIIIRGKHIIFGGKANLESKGDKGVHNKSNASCPVGVGSGGVIWINGTITPSSYSNYLKISNENFCGAIGAIIINGKRYLTSTGLNGGDYQGCYSRSKNYTNDVGHPSEVFPSNCRTKCGIGCSYVALYDNVCACLGNLQDFTEVDDAMCNERCSGCRKFICGGSSNTTATIYSVHKAVNSTNITINPACSKYPVNVTSTNCSGHMCSSDKSTTTPTIKNVSTSAHASLPPTKPTRKPSSSPKVVSLSTSPPPSPSTISTSTPSASAILPGGRKVPDYSAELIKLKNSNITTENCDSTMEKLDNITNAMANLNTTDITAVISVLEQIIEVGNKSTRSPQENTHLAKSTLNIAEKLLDARLLNYWTVIEKNENKSLEIVLKLVENIFSFLGTSMEVNETLKLNSTSFVSYTEVIDPMYFKSRNYAVNGFEIKESLNDKNQSKYETISIPASLIESIKGASRFSLNLLKYQEKPVTVSSVFKNWCIASNIISIFLDRSLKTKLKDNVALSFPITNERNDRALQESCRFLDYSNSGNATWITRGCTTTIENGKVICSCNHFTSFAVLLNVGHNQIDPIHEKVMHWITYVGCGISLSCLVVTVIGFFLLKLTTHDHTMIHTNLALSLIFAQVLFLLGIHATEIKITCKIIAIFLHYFYLAAVFWMLVEGIHLFRKVVKVFLKSNGKKYYLIFGWVSPMVVVSASALAYFDGYGTEKACWLSMEKGFVWAFATPVLIVIATNTTILIMVVRVMLIAIRSAPDHGEISNIKNGVKGVIFLLPLLGLTWVFGVLSVNSETLAFQYIFTITNSLQGFFIFLFHCFLNTEVRAAYKRQQDKSSLQRSINEPTTKHKKIGVVDSLTKTSTLDSVRKPKVHPETPEM